MNFVKAEISSFRRPSIVERILLLSEHTDVNSIWLAYKCQWHMADITLWQWAVSQWHHVVLNSLGMLEIWNRNIAIWIQKWKFKIQNYPQQDSIPRRRNPPLVAGELHVTPPNTTYLSPDLVGTTGTLLVLPTAHQLMLPITWDANETTTLDRHPSSAYHPSMKEVRPGSSPPIWQAKNISAFFKYNSMCARLHQASKT